MLITTADALAEVLARAKQASAVALDTEFITGHYYQPKIALVQLALSQSEAYILDPLAISLAPLGELLENQNVVKIFHAAAHDLQYLFRETDKWATQIFDTQIAMGFLGQKSAQSLQKLVQHYVGITLPKSAQQSDWLKRPINEKQLTYALNDVRYLPEIYASMKKELEAQQTWTMFQSELQYRFFEPKEDKKTAFYQINGFQKLQQPQKVKFAYLFDLRDQLARSENLHRSRLMTDEALMRLVKVAHPTQQTLNSIMGIHPQFIRKHGNKILHALENPPATPIEFPKPQMGISLNEEECLLVDFIQLWLKNKALEHNVDPSLLVNKNDAEKLLFAYQNHRLADLEGFATWKKALYAELLHVLWHGSAEIRFQDQKFVLQSHLASD